MRYVETLRPDCEPLSVTDYGTGHITVWPGKRTKEEREAAIREAARIFLQAIQKAEQAKAV